MELDFEKVIELYFIMIFFKVSFRILKHGNSIFWGYKKTGKLKLSTKTLWQPLLEKNMETCKNHFLGLKIGNMKVTYMVWHIVDVHKGPGKPWKMAIVIYVSSEESLEIP